jgi:lipopolysaccharide transport system ATP-binding protein
VRSLDDVRLEIAEGEVFGIVGRNGAGKSTLLKILSRIVAPTSGRAVVRGRVGALLEVGTGMHPEMTGRENILLNGALLGMSRREVAESMDRILEFAGIGAFADTPIKRYSSGMQLRIAFAVAAHLVADILLVDEVLAVGDAEFQAKCLRSVRDGVLHGRTTLFVSHNMAAVERHCDRVAWLDGGRVRLVGLAPEVIAAYLSASTGREGMERTLGEEEQDPAAPVRVRAVRVAGGGGPVVQQGEDVLLHLDLDVARAVPALQVLASLGTQEGEPVLGVRNGDVHAQWSVEPGAWEVTVRLRDVRLLPRRYCASFRLFDASLRETFQVLDRIVEFPVQPRDVLGSGVQPLADRGVTWTPAEFGIRPRGENRP